MGDRSIRVFLSYHREDDTEAFPGVIDQFFRELVGQIQAESPVEVLIFKDVDSMVAWQNWRDGIYEAIAGTSIFIPVVTLRWFRAPVCMEELDAFRTNTPLDELPAAVLPLVLAGHSHIKPEAEQEQVRFVESLNWRDMRHPYLQGQLSPEWRKLVFDVASDILAWHEKYSSRQAFIEQQLVAKISGSPTLSLDEQFLDDNGLAALPEDQKTAFLQSVFNELQMRVGVRLVEGMPEDLLDEFGYFIDGDVPAMEEWFKDNIPRYGHSEAFRTLKDAYPQASDADIMSEYGAMMWLSINRQGYPLVVKQVFEELTTEIRANANEILKGTVEFPTTQWD